MRASSAMKPPPACSGGFLGKHCRRPVETGKVYFDCRSDVDRRNLVSHPFAPRELVWGFPKPPPHLSSRSFVRSQPQQWSSVRDPTRSSGPLFLAVLCCLGQRIWSETLIATSRSRSSATAPQTGSERHGREQRNNYGVEARMFGVLCKQFGWVTPTTRMTPCRSWQS